MVKNRVEFAGINMYSSTSFAIDLVQLRGENIRNIGWNDMISSSEIFLFNFFFIGYKHKSSLSVVSWCPKINGLDQLPVLIMPHHNPSILHSNDLIARKIFSLLQPKIIFFFFSGTFGYASPHEFLSIGLSPFRLFK